MVNHSLIHSCALLLLSGFTLVSPKRFGTLRGYDNEGGTDPICWMISKNTTFSVDDYSVDFLQSKRGELLRNNPESILSECHLGTLLNLTFKEKEGTIISGRDASFHLEISLDPATFQDDNLVMAPPNRIAWRVKFCDASKIGFCTPFSKSQHNHTFQDMYFLSNFSLDTMKSDEGGNLTIDKDFNLRVPEGMPGTYYVIGHAVIFLGPNNTTGSVLLEFANALRRRILTIKDPPLVLMPTDAYKIGASILLGLVGIFQLALLMGVIFYRHNQVMHLSQPKFLALLLLCSLIASMSCILFIPESDLFCNLWPPLIMIPISMIASILIARIWRMHILLSATRRIALVPRKEYLFEDHFMRCLTFLASWQELLHDELSKRIQKRPTIPRRRSLSITHTNIRQEVRDFHVLRLILTLTLPQVICQLIWVIKYPASVQIIEHDSVSIFTCRNTHWLPFFFSFSIIIILFLMAVVVAWISRDLPSLFNEKAQVFNASWISFLIILFAGMMISLTDFEFSSPDTRSFLWTVVTLCVTLSPCYYVVLPKVMRARKGETVVMSRLFASPSVTSSMDSNIDPRASAVSTAAAAVAAEDEKEGADLEREGEDEDVLERFRTDEMIVLQKFDPPPRELEYQLLTMRELIVNISQSSIEGRHISKHDWEILQYSLVALNNHMDRLQFDWDESENGEEVERYRERVTEVFTSHVK